MATAANVQLLLSKKWTLNSNDAKEPKRVTLYTANTTGWPHKTQDRSSVKITRIKSG